jgi:hypothetical protein
LQSKPSSALAIAACLCTLLVMACALQGSPAVPATLKPEDATGIRDLDAVVGAALSGDSGALMPYLEFMPALCTTERALGGPPKCLPGEHDGTPVNVLPFLGPEGSFLRELDAPAWIPPRMSRLYAVYKVSDAAYSDANYPAGEYALVFATDDAASAPITLQVSQGRIVRIDYGAGWPPQIPPEAVDRYLVSPP